MTTDLSDLAPAPAECGTVIIRGPKGDKGDQGDSGASGHVTVNDPITLDGTGTADDPYVVGLGLSEDAANAITVGSDGGLYAPVADGSETSVTAGTNIQVSGTGTAGDPYIVSATGVVTSVTAADNTVDVTPTSGDVVVKANVSAETGNHLTTGTDGGLYATGTSVTAADGTVTVTGDDTTGYEVAANISADENNTLVAGDDGGLYVPTMTAIGTDSYLIGDSLTRTGSGTAEDPYVLDVNISGDAGNTITTGSDGALYSAGTTVTAGPGIDVAGDSASGFTVASNSYATVSAVQLSVIDGSSTPFPTAFDTVPPQLWPSLDVTAPFDGYMRITISAKCINTNTPNATIYAGFGFSYDGEVTGGSTYRAVGALAGGGVLASRSRIYSVTAGTAVSAWPVYRATSYSTDSGKTQIDVGSLDVEFFAADLPEPEATL